MLHLNSVSTNRQQLKFYNQKKMWGFTFAQLSCTLRHRKSAVTMADLNFPLTNTSGHELHHSHVGDSVSSLLGKFLRRMIVPAPGNSVSLPVRLAYGVFALLA